jgi:hypothetical protein
MQPGYRCVLTEPTGERFDPRSGGGPNARRLRRTLRDPGGPASAAPPLPSGRPPLSSRLRRDALSRRRRRDPRRRMRCPVGPAPNARSCISASIRSSRAIRSGVFHETSRVTCTAATALPQLSAVLDRRVDEAAVANRRQRGAEQRERLVALWLKTCENAANARPIDMARGSACIARVKPRMRSSSTNTPRCRSIAGRTGRAAISGRARLRGSAGVAAPRSAPSSRPLTAW